MLKVIIADDELHIRNLLKYLIHWEELGLTFAAEYDNGPDVVEHVEREHIDIIITDIQMPGMDGLDMIRAVRETDPNSRFIVVSGYRDFAYAQTAVKLGVSDYILKPIDEDELNAALAALVGNGGGEGREQDKRDERRKSFLPVLRGHRVVMDAEQANREFGFHFMPSGCYFVAWMAICRAKRQENTTERAQKKMEILKDRLESCCHDLESFMLSDLTCALLLQCAPDRRDEVLRTACDAYQELLRKEIPGDELRYYLSVGKAVYDLREIQGSMESARFFIAGRIQYGTRRVYIADYMQCADALQSQSIHIPYETGRSLDSALERTDEAAMKQAIRDAFAFYRVTGQKNPTLCFAIARQIGEVLVQKLSQFGASPGKTRRVMEELETRLDNSDTEEQVQAVVENICGEAVHRHLLGGRTEQNAYILQAKSYIDAHYGENISLALLAEKIHINPAYLSTLFKNEVGVNYQDYLTAVRIDKAKQLLAGEPMNISQVANAVGYGSARYFSKTFEAQTGIRPAEYRRLRMRRLEG